MIRWRSGREMDRRDAGARGYENGSVREGRQRAWKGWRNEKMEGWTKTRGKMKRLSGMIGKPIILD